MERIGTCLDELKTDGTDQFLEKWSQVQGRAFADNVEVNDM